MLLLNSKTLKKLLTTSMTAIVLASCSGGGGGGGGSYSGGSYTGGSGGTSSGTGGTGGSTMSTFYNPSETVDQFVNALNNVDGTSFDPSVVMLYENETLRSFVPGEDEWFVIYDSSYVEYKAVSLQYIRSIVYYDYYANSSSLAAEFRAIETDDILLGDFNGDYFGADYEVVTDLGGNMYQGVNSGMLYDDEEETEDVTLELQDTELKKFALSVSKISYMYKISLPTAMSIYTLGVKSKQLLKKGELTLADQLSLAGDLEKMTGQNANSIVEALSSEEKKAELLKNVAQKIGTTQDSLQNRILPDLFGIQL